MTAPPLGVFWGLRRLADDGGRFMLADLRGADAELLADLLTGLAPFTTGVVLDPEPGRAVWRRCATTLVGRVEAVADHAGLAAAKRSAADAVLAPAALAQAAEVAEIARLGADAGADLALAARAAGPWVAVGTDVAAAAALEESAPGLAGFLLSADFWREAAALDRAARSLRLADVLVPRLQALNARAADLPVAAWLDR